MMGKRVLLGVLSLVYLGASAAQSQTVRVGFKGGLHSSTIDWSTSPLGDQMGELHRRHTIVGGVVLAVDGPVNLRLRSELLLNGKGFSESQDFDAILRARVDYLEVPVLIGWAVPVRSLVAEPYVGPWLAWETGCDLTLETPVLEISYDCDDIPGEPVLRQTTDWGMAAGVAITIPSRGRLGGFFDLRYSAGLRNIDRSPRIENMRFRHRGYSATGGILVTLGS
jgi:hypothetical protein